MRRFRGLVWRHVPVGAEPLHLGWILKGARGRWNTRRPRLPCIYTALTPEGAIAEYEKQVAAFGGPPRRDLVSLRVSVGPVLDLTSRFVRRRFGIRLDAIVGDACTERSERGADDLAQCRTLARRQVLDGPYHAILAPSAALADAVNLMIYVASTSGIRELADGPDRVTIVPGFRWPGA